MHPTVPPLMLVKLQNENRVMDVLFIRKVVKVFMWDMDYSQSIVSHDLNQFC